MDELTDQLKDLTLKEVTPLNERLGRGSYGSVFTVKCGGVVCAAKKIHSILVDEDVSLEQKQTIKRQFVRECICCSGIRHPNIVQFLGVYYSEESTLPIMVMELMDTSLTSFVENNKSQIAIQTKMSILYDVSQGLCFLHNHKPQILHRDLSPNNVLLTRCHITAKIGDLGVAKVVKADNRQTKSKLTTAPGTLHFMPPEALVEDNPAYGTPMDVFSFGGIALYVFSEEWPTPGGQKMIDPATEELVALSEVKRREKYLDKMTGKAAMLKEMVERCLNDSPKKRPQIQEVSAFIEPLKKPNSDIIHMDSLSNDVLTLMRKSGIYKHDYLTYDPEAGCVIIHSRGDEETASTIAEAFQAQYNQVLMGGALREYFFPILYVDNMQKIDELVKQLNNDYSQSLLIFDHKNIVIKCLSLDACQMAHIKTKVKYLLEKLDDSTTSASVVDTHTSMSLTLPGGRRVTLKQANIVDEAVDVIANAANNKLSHIGRVAAAINKASHNLVQFYSTHLLQQHGGPLATGQAVYTAAGGALKCKHIIHTIGPQAYKHGNQSQHLLWTACMNTLQLAEKLKATSLAIPPISTGLFQVPKDLVAETIIQTVCSYPGYTEGVLRDIRIVIIDKETYEVFKPSFVDMRTNWNAGVATTKPPIHDDSANTPPVLHTGLCPVCQGNIDNPVVTPCQHKYCRGCLTKLLRTSPYCPVCNKQLRDITGNQPDGGRMSHQILRFSLPGYESYHTIKITYYIPNGTQGANHPHPGRQFSGDTRYAYLPDSPEGKEVLALLEKAFDAKLLFTVGKSATTNRDNTVVWSDIQQKSRKDGGPQRYGYPDAGYLKRVKEQLWQKGIIEGELI